MTLGAIPPKSGSLLKRYTIRYCILFPLALFEAAIYAQHAREELRTLVLVELVLLCYLIALVMTLVAWFLRDRSWDEALTTGFWTAIVWILLLGIYNLLKP